MRNHTVFHGVHRHHAARVTVHDVQLGLRQLFADYPRSRCNDVGHLPEHSILDSPKRLPDFVGVFDNKGSVEDKPRLGVVFNGSVEYVTDGDASVLAAHDLERISLIDAAAALYVACTSLGKTHVFRLQQTATGYAAIQLGDGPASSVPEGAATDSWSNPTRTNGRSPRCLASAPPALGGDNYAAQPGARAAQQRLVRASKLEEVPKGSRRGFGWRPFDPTTGMVDETSMTQQPFKNLGDTPAWRALSSLDIVGDQMYFTCAYDGEEDGKAVSTEGSAPAPTRRRSDRSSGGLRSPTASQPSSAATTASRSRA